MIFFKLLDCLHVLLTSRETNDQIMHDHSNKSPGALGHISMQSLSQFQRQHDCNYVNRRRHAESVKVDIHRQSIGMNQQKFFCCSFYVREHKSESLSDQGFLKLRWTSRFSLKQFSQKQALGNLFNGIKYPLNNLKDILFSMNLGRGFSIIYLPAKPLLAI